jgi:hypothetical protein
VPRLAERREVGEVLGLDPVERRLVVLRGVRRTPQHDELERLEIHGASVPSEHGLRLEPEPV